MGWIGRENDRLVFSRALTSIRHRRARGARQLNVTAHHARRGGGAARPVAAQAGAPGEPRAGVSRRHPIPEHPKGAAQAAAEHPAADGGDAGERQGEHHRPGGGRRDRRRAQIAHRGAHANNPTSTRC